MPHLPLLHQGRWLIGSEYQIPLTHPDWFQYSKLSLLENNLLDGTVVELIDYRSKSWRNDLVKKLYQFLACEEILQLPLPRTSGIEDRLLWKHSTSGEYKVNKAYRMLYQNHYLLMCKIRGPMVFLTLRGLIWKVKLPLKILTFIWKLLHDSLPVFEVLNNRGITVSSKCLICNEDEESINHLFMHCPFARAIWHGSNLEIRTSELHHSSFKQWVKACILQNEPEENNRMCL